ncbi:hypothetical protein Tco_0458509 [Tanacetum coccineum]
MIQVKEMMQDNDLKNSKSKDKGSKSRSQSMNEQSRYKQDKTKTRQSINVKSHVFNVKGDNDKSKQTPTRMSSVRKRTTDQFILVRRDQAPHDSTTGPSSQPEDDTSEKVVHESLSNKESDEQKVKQKPLLLKAGSDPEKVHEALAGPDPEPMREDQTGSDSGKLIANERVIEDNLESHSGSMSSMKNLEDTDNFGDQFLYDKPTEDDQEKSKVVDESDSTIPDLSHQTVTLTPPVIAPVIDFSSPKPSSLVTPPPINTEATTITIYLLEITPFIALQLRVARLEQEMSEYLGTKLDDALLGVLERHTADLIEKYSVLSGPESIKNQESKKSPKEIIKIKREQGEKKQESQQYTISQLNPANYHLYHAFMEALIIDEDAMDKEGKSSKRRTHDSGAFGSAQPPPKDDEQSSKKPHDSNASASKQHPTLTSTGWQITDIRDAVIDSSMHSFESESGHSEHSSDDVSKQDEGHISDLEDTDNTYIPKVKAATWFKPIQEDERPATPEPEWTIPPNDFPELENNWANAYATSYQVPVENKLQRKTYDIGSFIKWFCRRTRKKNLCKADLEGPAFNLVKAFHKNNDMEYLLTGDKEQKTALSISKLKAARYPDFGLEELVPSLWAESELDYDISAAYGITHWWFKRKEFYINKHSEPSDCEAVRSQMRILKTGPSRIVGRLAPRRLRAIRNLKLNLKRPNWDATDYFFKEDYTIVPKPRAVIQRDRNDQRKLIRLNEIHNTIRAWRLGNGQRMTRGGAKTSSQRSRKDYRSGGSFKVWKALLEKE